MKDFRNELLKRREVQIIVGASSNPGFGQAKKALAETFKVNEEAIAIQALRSHFGSSNFLIDAHIYDSVAAKNRIEPKPKVKKAPAGAA